MNIGLSEEEARASLPVKGEQGQGAEEPVAGASESE
jgi:hypothetical protein